MQKVRLLSIIGFSILGVVVYFKTDSEIASLRAIESSTTSVVWHWENSFSGAEQQKIESWLSEVIGACHSSFGAYPFNTHIHLYKQSNSTEPVPWAHTRRYSSLSVHFYVDTDFSLEAFLNDWTAPHELSHLSLPFLGSEHAWFSEGYASFMQYQLMMEMGVMTHRDVENKYHEKLQMIRPSYTSATDAKSIAMEMQAGNRYPEMYWGGAIYFMILDKQLKEQGASLSGLIREYLVCCRINDDSLTDVLKSWDRILDNSMATKLYREFTTEPSKKVLTHLM